MTIKAGQTTGAVKVTLEGDTDVEPDETFNVVLTLPANAVFAAPGDADAVITIQNDD